MENQAEVRKTYLQRLISLTSQHESTLVIQNGEQLQECDSIMQDYTFKELYIVLYKHNCQTSEQWEQFSRKLQLQSLTVF